MELAPKRIRSRDMPAQYPPSARTKLRLQWDMIGREALGSHRDQSRQRMAFDQCL
jgi:hypothetical protein